MRFLPAFIIALVALGFSHFAKAASGTNGVITKLHQTCAKPSSMAEHKAMQGFDKDVREIYKLQMSGQAIPSYLERSRDIRQAEIIVQKVKCFSNLLNGSGSDVGLLPDLTPLNIERFSYYRQVISQLSLYKGQKLTEVGKLANSEHCKKLAGDDQIECVAAQVNELVQGFSIAMTVTAFLDLYMKEVDKTNTRQSTVIGLTEKLENSANADLKARQGQPSSVPLNTKSGISTTR